MAFIGPVTEVWTTRNLKEVTGMSLSANAGVFDPTGAAADSGLLTTDATTTPAGAIVIPTSWGPGEGNWTQADVNVLGAWAEDATVPGTNAKVVVAQKALVGGNLQVGIHSTDIAAVTGITVRLNAEWTGSR